MHDRMERLKPPSEFSGFGDCAKHGEYPTTMIQLPDSTTPLPGPCPKCDVVDIEQRRKMKSKQKMIELNRQMERSGIPKRFLAKSFDGYEPANAGQQRAKAIAMRYADNFPERFEAAGCLIFLGPVGTGKTHLACSIGNQVIAAGFSCMFTTVIDAVRLVRSTYGNKSDLTEAQAIHRFTWPDLLILDEVGMQHGSDNEFLILTELINLRYADQKPTIMLSNMTPEKFESFVGIRVFDRMHENGGMLVEVTGQSHRRNTG